MNRWLLHTMLNTVNHVRCLIFLRKCIHLNNQQLVSVICIATFGVCFCDTWHQNVQMSRLSWLSQRVVRRDERRTTDEQHKHKPEFDLIWLGRHR